MQSQLKCDSSVKQWFPQTENGSLLPNIPNSGNQYRITLANIPSWIGSLAERSNRMKTKKNNMQQAAKDSPLQNKQRLNPEKSALRTPTRRRRCSTRCYVESEAVWYRTTNEASCLSVQDKAQQWAVLWKNKSVCIFSFFWQWTFQSTLWFRQNCLFSVEKVLPKNV